MTDMQNKLYPPLVDDNSDYEDYDGGNRCASNPNAKNNSGKSKSVLSNDLQDRFKSMRSLLRGIQGEEEGNISEEMKRKQRQMATETALLVESEVSRLESGIAELENLLCRQQQQQGHGQDQESHNQHFFHGGEVVQGGNEGVLVFPSLPSIVAEEEEEEEEESEAEEKSHITRDKIFSAS
jgi:hypothetical protein